jgi:hypothetical protein
MKKDNWLIINTIEWIGAILGYAILLAVIPYAIWSFFFG